jgi:hypothetical protein
VVILRQEVFVEKYTRLTKDWRSSRLEISTARDIHGDLYFLWQSFGGEVYMYHKVFIESGKNEYSKNEYKV